MPPAINQSISESINISWRLHDEWIINSFVQDGCIINISMCVW